MDNRGLGARQLVLAATLRDTRRHPGSAVQNLLGALTGLFTSGTFGRGPAGSGWVYLERARGLGTAIPRLSGGHTAITIGCVTFSATALDPAGRLYHHEYGHYTQSTAFGPFFLPLYFACQRMFGYGANPFERDAERFAIAVCRPDDTARA